MLEVSGSQAGTGAGCGQEDTFLLRPLVAGLFLKEEVSVSFAPVTNQETGLIMSIVPRLNMDGKPHTPSFILEPEMSELNKLQPMLLSIHEQKHRQYSPKTELFKPKPSGEVKKCHVCKALYQDYLDHIQHQMHRKKLKKSQYNQHIAELCEQLNKGKQESISRGQTGKKRLEECKREREHVFEEDGGRPLKKRKQCGQGFRMQTEIKRENSTSFAETSGEGGLSRLISDDSPFQAFGRSTHLSIRQFN